MRGWRPHYRGPCKYLCWDGMSAWWVMYPKQFDLFCCSYIAVVNTSWDRFTVHTHECIYLRCNPYIPVHIYFTYKLERTTSNMQQIIRRRALPRQIDTLQLPVPPASFLCVKLRTHLPNRHSLNFQIPSPLYLLPLPHQRCRINLFPLLWLLGTV